MKRICLSHLHAPMKVVVAGLVRAAYATGDFAANEPIVVFATDLDGGLLQYTTTVEQFIPMSDAAEQFSNNQSFGIVF